MNVKELQDWLSLKSEEDSVIIANNQIKINGETFFPPSEQTSEEGDDGLPFEFILNDGQSEGA